MLKYHVFTMHCYCTVLWFVLLFGAMEYKIKGYNTSISEAKEPRV